MAELRTIVLLSPAHPLRGGIASSTERLAVELQAHGYEASVVSFTLQYPSILFPGKTQYTDDPAPEGVAIDPQVNSINPVNWWRVGRRLARRRPDLIIVRYWLPFLAPALGTICRLARRNGHTRVIALADNILPHEARPGDRLLTRYFVGSVDGFLVMSKTVGEEVRRFTATKPVRFVPHPLYDNYGERVGRDQALAHLGLPDDRRYVLFFGFVRAYKGLDLLLRALADPRLQDLPLTLLVAGEFYDDPKPYHDLIQDLGFSERVRLFDRYIPHEEVKYYFGAADLVVQPYRTATQSGISQLAYHFERPMVVTRVGGLPEIIRHGEEGYVVDVSSEAIAAAVADFFQQNRTEAMGRAVGEGKSRFSWARLVEGIEELVEKFRNGEV